MSDSTTGPKPTAELRNLSKIAADLDVSPRVFQPTTEAVLANALAATRSPIEIYLAGPLGAGEAVRAANTLIAIEQADELHERFGNRIEVFVPHLFNAWHNARPHDRRYWFRKDFIALLRCRAVFRIPGESYGADVEEALASVVGIPVFHTVHDLGAWLDSLLKR